MKRKQIQRGNYIKKRFYGEEITQSGDIHRKEDIIYRKY